MKEVTPEEIYAFYHHEAVFKTKGVHANPISSFDAIRQKDSWIYFERFAKMVNNNVGMINWKLYIKSLIDFYNGFFETKLLCHPSSIKIYKTELKIQQDCNDNEIIENKVMQSLKNVVEYMKEQHIKEFILYLNENSALLPTLARHFCSDTISKQFLALIPNVILIINSFPADVVEEFFADFKTDYPTIRAKTIGNEKLRKISDNMEVIVNNLLKM